MAQAPGSPFDVAYATATLTAADFNGDGKLDLAGATPDQNGGPFTVYINNGNGTFTTKPSFDTGFDTGLLIAGDFNGDSKQDLAFTSGNAIGVLLGRGDGTFGPAASYLVGNNPVALVAGDFNGDGKQDLAVVNGQDGTLSILLANQNGTFRPAITFPLGNGPTDVGVGDFNHDGKLDIVVTNTNTNDNDVEIFLGNGNGTFKPGTTFAAGPLPAQIAVADFNRDGNLDLGVNNPSTNAVTVLLGNGDGTFRNPTSYAAGINPGAPAAVDLNGDGIPDLIVPDVGANTLYVLLANGDGTFATALSVPTPIYSGGTRLLIGDFNGDGTPDVSALQGRWNAFTLLNEITLLSSPSNNTILVNNTLATHFGFSATPTYVTADTTFSATITALGQSNNIAPGYTGTVHFTSSDTLAGLPADLALTNGVGTFVATLHSLGNQTLIATDTVNSSLTGTTNNITVTAPATHFAVSAIGNTIAGTGFTITVNALDLSNNAAAGYTGTVHFTSSDSQAVLPADATLTNGSGTFTVSLETAGSQIIAASDKGTVSITGTTGPITVSAAAATHFALTPASGITAGVAFSFTITAQDRFNNTATGYTGTVHFTSSDSQAVLPAGATFAAGVGIFSATLKTAGSQTLKATGPFSALTTNFVQPLGSPIVFTGATACVAGDFNSDGKLDLAVTSNPDIVAIFLGNGNGTFALSATYAVGKEPYAVAVGDFNGDGKQDLAVANLGSSSLSILMGNGNGTFGPVTNYVVGSGPSAIAIADFNNDGKLDVIVANSSSNFVSVLLGNGNGTFLPAANYTVGTDPTGVVIADFNKDGNLDLAVVSSLTGGVSVLLGNGNGTFEPAVIISGVGSKQIEVGDFNGDGNPDLVVTTYNVNSESDSVDVLLGNGNGTFGPAVAYNTNADPWGVAVADVNGDGKLDLVVTNLLGANISVLIGDGNGSFGTDQSFPVGLSPEALTTGDFNGDGVPDVAVANVDSGTISILLDSDVISGAATALVKPAAASHFTVTAPSIAPAGAAASFTVTALDPFNNIGASYNGTAVFASTDPTATLPAAMTLPNGVGTFSVTLNTLGNQTLTVTDAVTSTIMGTSNAITVSGPATHFVLSSPITTTAGQAFNFTVTALDTDNVTALGYSGTVSFSSSDSPAILPSNSTLVNGVGTFNVILKTAGGETLITSDATTGSITGLSNSITVVAAAATHFSVSGIPAGITAGAGFSFTATALDQFNNTAMSYSGTVEFSSTDKGIFTKLPGPSSLTGGLATFSATLTTVGSEVLMVADQNTGSISAANNQIVVRPAAASHFTVTVPAVTIAGYPQGFTVIALDPFNNAATGYGGTIYFTSSDSAATVPADSPLLSGTGTFSATLQTLGSQTLAATDAVMGGITGTSNGIIVTGPASHFQVRRAGQSHGREPPDLHGNSTGLLQRHRSYLHRGRHLHQQRQPSGATG